MLKIQRIKARMDLNYPNTTEENLEVIKEKLNEVIDFLNNEQRKIK